MPGRQPTRAGPQRRLKILGRIRDGGGHRVTDRLTGNQNRKATTSDRRNG